MVQTVSSCKILAGEKRIVLEKPHTLRRIFFSIYKIAAQTSWYVTWISFGDPQFYSYFTLSGSLNSFAAEGADVFQGDIWAYNVSDADFWYSLTEILH